MEQFRDQVTTININTIISYEFMWIRLYEKTVPGFTFLSSWMYKQSKNVNTGDTGKPTGIKWILEVCNNPVVKYITQIY